MFRLLVLAVALAACVADEEPQASASPILVDNDHYHRVDADRLKDGIARLRADLHHVIDHRRHDDHRRDDRHRDDRHRDDRHRDDRHHDRHRVHHNDGRWWEHRIDQFEHEEPEGPIILRSIRPDGHTPDIARQNKIIADVFSPDYAEPTWVLDYRYLKSGGRDYTRGPGGQIIILPKGIHTNEEKEFKDYDELIEHLRLKNLAERKKPQYFMPLGQGADHDHDDRRNDHGRYGDHRDGHRDYNRHDDHGDNMWGHRAN